MTITKAKGTLTLTPNHYIFARDSSKSSNIARILAHEAVIGFELYLPESD